MQSASLFSKKISVFCKFRRNIFNTVNRNEETPNLNTIHLSTSADGEGHAGEDETGRHEEAVEGGANLCKEEHIPYNLIREKHLYGVNLNVDLFLLKNSNIVFFLHNVINIYNPMINSLRTLFTKNDCVITCSFLHGDSLIVVLYGSARCSCIQIYCTERQTLKEEIQLDDHDFYERIYVQKENNHFVLITNKRVLKVLDSEKKTFILNIFLHLEYCDIAQYYDFFLILRKRKLFLWNLERTYTGLKIKEKNLEIDSTLQVNCFGFCERHILIGTSDGRLFLLKDLVEKYEMKNENGEAHLHKSVSYVHYYDGYITTKDGDSLKLWACQFSGANLPARKELTIKLEKEVPVQVNVSKIIPHEKFFLLIDKKNCAIYSSKKNNYDDLSTFFYTHNSKIKKIFCWKNNIFSFSYNGKVFDYQLDEKRVEREYCLHRFRDFITCVKYLYQEEGFFFFCIGFTNGVIYIVKVKHLFLDIVTCVKTSNNSIVHIERGERCKYICVIAKEEEYVFFLHKQENAFEPLGYLRICEAELRGSFYLPSTRSFYILGARNLLFRVYEEWLAACPSEFAACPSDQPAQSPPPPAGAENPYDLRVEYEILEVQFTPAEESPLYGANSAAMERTSGLNCNECNECNDGSHDCRECSDSEGESPLDSSASDISQGECEKMNFYRDKMSLTRGTEEESEKRKSGEETPPSIQLSLFNNKRKNLQKYVETLFGESVMSKLEKRRRRYPTCLSINLERDKRKEEEKENAEEEKKNKKNKLNTGKGLLINITCVAKMNDNGFVLTTEGIKNNCIFFLHLNGRSSGRYRTERGRRKTILRPTVVYKIARKNFPERVSIVSMIVNEANHLLFCLTNHNNIFVFSTRYFFLYYRVKIPLYEKVRNIYVNEGEKKRQYIFVSLGNNYIKLDFHFFFVHLFNVLKRYHVSGHREQQVEAESSAGTNGELPKEETPPNGAEKDRGHPERNDIADIWNFIHNNNKAEERNKIEEQKKKINLILNYDQRNMTTIFNTNDVVQDENILYSLRETKEAKENEENVKRALLHKKNMIIKINKLKKKYMKFFKKKKFLIDVDMSKRIYKNLKNKIKEYKRVLAYNQREEKNKKLKIVNNEDRIEEICFKKKIIKMYEQVLAQLDQLENSAAPPRPPRRISSITEIIRNYEDDKRKLLRQINFIKEMFNEDFRAAMSQMGERMAQMQEEVLFLREALQKEKTPGGRAAKGEEAEPGDGGACPASAQLEVTTSNEVTTCGESEKGPGALLDHLGQFILKRKKQKRGWTIAKMSSINFDGTLFERKDRRYDREEIERQLERVRKKFDEQVNLLHMKKIEAIRIIKFICLKIVAINEKNSILMELRKREEQKEKNLQRLKEMMGEDSLCYRTLIKGLHKNQDEASDEEENGSEGPASECAELGQPKEDHAGGEDRTDLTDRTDRTHHTDRAHRADPGAPPKQSGLHKADQVDRIKKENISIVSGMNNIKKNIEHKKNEQRKLLTKKKNIEKEVHMLNEEMKIIEEDKKKNVSQVKFYILLKISKLRNIDYLYDKKKYRLNLSSNCAIISREQYADVRNKMETLMKRKEELTRVFTTLKRENAELENGNNKLYKNMNDKKNALKNKLKKNDLIFDFNDLEKKYQEKKKKGIIQEIKNTEMENNRQMNLLHRQLDRKTAQLNDVRRRNTLLLEKINQYIQVLKGRAPNNPVGQKGGAQL
ncbi:hypothetical protein PVIIG_00067 [Plasmodium vivax India VII]|uniref:Uncharacterized protein n=1 Tax=Plasmodium vivax India VII TaxID=1077284 RepID=A0A0J9S9N2_PLAVI|nr:hypothetical protein PVIIG_00067 [Plasmodium vivax India VII]